MMKQKWQDKNGGWRPTLYKKKKKNKIISNNIKYDSSYVLQ